MDQHNRPYKCTVAGCTHPNGFGSTGELKRHKNSVHKQFNSFFYCPVPGCSRSSSSSNKNPFSRKDNRQEHINRQHKDLFPKHPTGLEGGSNPPPGNQDIPNSDLSEWANPADQVNVTVRGTRKRRRLPERTLSPENADSTNEELHGLREENKKLKREIEGLKCELELSKKRGETLVDVIKHYTER